jgi:hypothetical protein
MTYAIVAAVAYVLGMASAFAFTIYINHRERRHDL